MPHLWPRSSSSEVEEYPNILESGPNPEFIAGITKGGGPLKDRHTTTLKLCSTYGASNANLTTKPADGTFDRTLTIHGPGSTRTLRLKLRDQCDICSSCKVHEFCGPLLSRFRKLRGHINTLARLYLKRRRLSFH